MNVQTKIETAADYTYWQNALAGNFGPIHDGDAQPGFYRKRTGKSAGYVPVAIWNDGGTIRALVDGREADAADIWTFVCQHPILEEWYRARMDGQRWPDEDAAVTGSLAHVTNTNSAPTDPAEILLEQIEAASAGVEQYSEITDDLTAAKAQSLRSRLLELSGDADKLREALVRPHLDAQKAANEKWQPLVKGAKAAADLIRAALGAHETRKAKAAALIAAEEEAARVKAAAKAAKLAAAGKPVPVDPVPVAPEQAPAPAAAIRGAYGRAAAIKVVRVARVVDQDKAYSGLKTHPEMIQLIARLAQRAVDAGITVSGVEFSEERKVA